MYVRGKRHIWVAFFVIVGNFLVSCGPAKDRRSVGQPDVLKAPISLDISTSKDAPNGWLVQPTLHYEPLKAPNPLGGAEDKSSAQTIELTDIQMHSVVAHEGKINLGLNLLFSDTTKYKLELEGVLNGEKALLVNAKEKKIKAVFVCLDKEKCKKAIIDVYLGDSNKRSRQFIVEPEGGFIPDTAIQQETPTTILRPIKNDVVITSVYSNADIHDADEVSLGEYTGVNIEVFNQEDIQPKLDSPPIKKEDSKLGFLAYSSEGGEALDHYNRGSLRNATLMPESGEGFVKVNRFKNKNYASGFMVDFLQQNARLYRDKVGTVEAPLYINALSSKSGGALSEHKSHQNGLDADLSYFPGEKWKFTSILVNSKGVPIRSRSVGCQTQVSFHPDFDVEQNFLFLKQSTQSEVVDRIFVNCNIKRLLCTWGQKKGQSFMDENKEVFRRLRTDRYHHDHLHIRLKCHSEYPSCRPPLDEVPQGSGC